MKSYQEIKNGEHFIIDGMTIPSVLSNRHYRLMMEEVEKGEAEILPTIKESQTEKEAAQNKADGVRYLSNTDWYVIRKMEKNIPIPANISTARDEARGKVGL